ncbi:MAG: ferrous iron transport protein A [Clostridia bacterium]|nr:ferrous iron transport protein A [Clostridia bacterium]
MYITLDKLKVGQSCQVKSIDIIEKEKKRHLLDMGLTRGVKIKIKRIAPMGDPVSIELRGYILSVSKQDLENIWVEIIR